MEFNKIYCLFMGRYITAIRLIATAPAVRLKLDWQQDLTVSLGAWRDRWAGRGGRAYSGGRSMIMPAAARPDRTSDMGISLQVEPYR
eukprot:752365-Hanusia_phi.AAC.2